MGTLEDTGGSQSLGPALGILLTHTLKDELPQACLQSTMSCASSFLLTLSVQLKCYHQH